MPFDFYFEKQVNVKKKKKYENCTTYFINFISLPYQATMNSDKLPSDQQTHFWCLQNRKQN